MSKERNTAEKPDIQKAHEAVIWIFILCVGVPALLGLLHHALGQFQDINGAASSQAFHQVEIGDAEVISR